MLRSARTRGTMRPRSEYVVSIAASYASQVGKKLCVKYATVGLSLVSMEYAKTVGRDCINFAAFSRPNPSSVARNVVVGAMFRSRLRWNVVGDFVTSRAAPLAPKPNSFAKKFSFGTIEFFTLSANNVGFLRNTPFAVSSGPEKRESSPGASAKTTFAKKSRFSRRFDTDIAKMDGFFAATAASDSADTPISSRRNATAGPRVVSTPSHAKEGCLQSTAPTDFWPTPHSASTHRAVARRRVRLTVNNRGSRFTAARNARAPAPSSSARRSTLGASTRSTS